MGKIKTWSRDEIAALVEHFGSSRALCKKYPVRQASLSEWMAGKRKISPIARMALSYIELVENIKDK
jgi:hypothetical protein